MGPVGLGVQPSVPAASQAPAAQLGISDPAMYDKWRQVAWRVAAELGREAELPPLGPGSRAKLLDGHPLAASDPRLEALRHPWAAPWPGQILVGLASAAHAGPRGRPVGSRAHPGTVMAEAGAALGGTGRSVER